MKNKYKKSGLWDFLFVFKRNIEENIKKEGLDSFDLTFSQVGILRFIGPSGKETMKSIADHLGVTPPSATEIVKEMEKKSLVKRINDKKDRRVVYIILSPPAKKLSVLLYKQKELMFKKMLSKLNKKDYESFERIIRILITD